jgi:HPt (histidine-containing phosphotransfer) domain-containing protein
MINTLAQEIQTPPRQSPRPRVLKGGAATLDMDRLSQTMALLEDYVDSMLTLESGPRMDPWVDDVDLEARMASL